MTAETGTYRWMAPEVIEHKPYNEKADVFSFGILLWELLTAKVPYSDLTPLQAAVGVVHKGLRPVVPDSLPPRVSELLRQTWRTQPENRPSFKELQVMLSTAMQELQQQAQQQAQQEERRGGGFLSKIGLGGGKKQ